MVALVVLPATVTAFTGWTPTYACIRYAVAFPPPAPAVQEMVAMFTPAVATGF
jgi:hypothetical protein